MESAQAILHPLKQIYDTSLLAVSYVEAADDGSWHVLWQNEAAQSLWGEFDPNRDLEFKLQLLSAQQRKIPCYFQHRLTNSVEPCQFTLVHYGEGILVQFMMAASHAQSSVTDKHTKVSNSLYREALEASGLGVLDWDVQADTVRYNDLFYQITDSSPVILGHQKSGFINLIHPKDRERFEEALYAHLEAHWPLNVSFRFQSGLDSYIWLQATGQASWPDGSESPSRMLLVLRDITGSKRVEDTVRQREALIEQILDSVPISIYVKDAQGCFRFFSHQTEMFTGIMRSQAIGRTDYEIYSLDFAFEQVELDEQAKQKGELMMSEHQWRVGGSDKWLMSGRGPIEVQREDQKVETWILGFSLDITERREMEEYLIQAREMAEAAANAKSEFLSVMSHEIRTPLNSVIGTSSLLLDSVDHPEQKQQIEMIKRSGEHLLHLINDILDFNKLDSGLIELEHETYNLYQHVEAIVGMMQTNAKAKNVGLKVNIDPKVTELIVGDQGRLGQVLLNLVGNAVKFTQQGEVSVTLRTVGDNAEMTRFEVRDTGIGIDPEHIDKLFCEFTQADASTTRKYGGTGLGLSISKKIIEAMKGDIGVDSVPGEGSCFWFELPTPAAKVESQAQKLPEQDYDKQHPLNILVAEDNASNQMLIRAILGKLNHKVTIANNGKEALDLVIENDADYDVLLMDMQMPEMDGLEATRQIRKIDSMDAQLLPIIALTANALAGDKERVIAAGMNDYLSKPIDIQALKRALWYWTHC